MASGTGSGSIKGNRPPRVHIQYENPGDGEEQVELPFVMGIMADLSGNNSPKEKPEFSDRSFKPVTASKLDEFMGGDHGVQPGLACQVRNTLEPDSGEKLNIDLQFRTMDDFSPAEVARQVPALKELLDARMQLANLVQYLIVKPEAQKEVRALLNDPDKLAALADLARRTKEADGEPKETAGDEA